jgi:deoxyadenosine/deoxycytidine kinase
LFPFIHTRQEKKRKEKKRKMSIATVSKNDDKLDYARITAELISVLERCGKPSMIDSHERIVVVSTDGGIGAGKTTYIERVISWVRETHPHISVVHVEEPLEELWKKTGIFQAFLRDQPKWAAHFQNFTYVTRIMWWYMRWQEALEIVKKDSEARVLMILERSPYSDKYFFAEKLNEDGLISDMEMCLYNLWFSFWSKCMPAVVDFGVWIDTSQEEAIRRVRERDRDGEKAYDPAYLLALDAKHRKHLSGGMFCGIPVMRVDGDKPFHECNMVVQQMGQALLARMHQSFEERGSGSNSPSPSPASISGSTSDLPPLSLRSPSCEVEQCCV